MKIAIIGCGDVGRCYATALTSAGHLVTDICDSNVSTETEEYAKSLGAKLHPSLDSWLSEADLVISAVFGGVALDVTKASIPYMKKHSIYADFTTGSPEDLRASARLAESAEVKFVDVAITGAIGLSGPRTPLLCAGTEVSELIDVLASIKAPIKEVGNKAGDAVSLKLLRSIFTKGLEALSVECLMAAEKKGLRKELYEVLSDIDQSPIRDFMEVLVTSHVKHAVRRLKEVQEARVLIESEEIQPLVLDGVEALFKRTANAITEKAFENAVTIENSLEWLFDVQKNVHMASSK